MSTTGRPALWEQVLDLDQSFFPRPWTRSQWESLDLSHHLLLTPKSEVVRGFVLFQISDHETAHLLKILVHPEDRGTGVAWKFWEEVVEVLKSKHFLRVYLEVEELNSRAIGFYQKLGFETLRRVKSYYSNGEAGVMMQLTL